MRENHFSSAPSPFPQRCGPRTGPSRVEVHFFLPVDITNILYGAAVLLTLVITTSELLQYRPFVLEARTLDFVAGLLFPLDCYAVLVLFGLPLTS